MVVLKKREINTFIKIHNFRYSCTQSFLKKTHLKNQQSCPACGLMNSKFPINNYFQESIGKSILAVWYGKEYLKRLLDKNFNLIVLTDFHKKYIDHNAKLINSLIVHNAEKHQEEIDKLSITLKAERKEREILDLNQKIELKNKELTSKAMIMAERQEALLKIFEEIDGIRKAHGGIMSPEFRKLYSDLQEQLSSDSQWDEFEKWFTEVQGDFFDHLRQKAPKLSSKELKISAFIKLRMSTKEIASLMRLTPKTIENHRWTIRKKIGLKKGDNLIQYLESI